MVEVSEERKLVFLQKNTVEHSHLAMEITTNVLITDTLRSNQQYKTLAGGKAYVKAEKHLIDVMEMPLWQPIGSPLLADEEGLNRAYSNNQNLDYDGDENYI